MMDKKTRKPRLPKYRLHKPSGLAFIELRGKRTYLGEHGSPESYEKYARKLAEHLQIEHTLDSKQRDNLSVNELLLKYLDYAEKRYTRNRWGTITQVRRVIRTIYAMYGSTLAAEFGPLSLRTVRGVWIEEKLSRSTINPYIQMVVRIWKWGVSHELVPATTWQALRSVPALRKNEGGKENKKVRPVSLDDVKITVRKLNPICRALVWFQLRTGCRPGEAIRLRMCDVDKTKVPWEWILDRHKTDWHEGREIKIILIGPKAQNAIRKLIEHRPDSAPVFDAAESFNWWRKRYMKTHGKYEKPNSRTPQEFTETGYYLAVKRACEASGVKRWSPNQLRHLAATLLRAKHGIEAARLILGHTTANTTEIYAERDFAMARQIAAQDG